MSKKSIIIASIVVISLLLLNLGVAFGTTGLSVSGGGSVTKGTSVTIRCAYSGSNLARGSVEIVYDSSVLQYTGCSGGNASPSSAGVLYVAFSTGGVGANNISFDVNFKAIAVGSGNVSVSTMDLVDTDYNVLEVNSGSTTVTVTNPAPQVSSNANLSSLKVSAGTLSPAFSAGRTSYTVSVDEDVTVCTISASAADSDAKVSVSGSKNLIMGNNVRKVTVTAPSGATKTYTITIIRGNADEGDKDDPNENEDESESLTVTIGDVRYIIQENINPEDVPEEFLLVAGKYDGKDIPLIKDADLKYTLALLKNDTNSDVKWFFYNEETGEFSETAALLPDEIMNLVKLSAGDKKAEDTGLFSDSTMILLMIFAGTLSILIVVVIVLQVKLLKGKDKNKKVKNNEESRE